MDCEICCNTSKIFALSACEHLICLKCILRLKHKVSQGQAKCPTCREDFLNIFLITDTTTCYSSLSRRSFTFNKEYGLFLPKDQENHYKKIIGRMFSYYCNLCRKKFHGPNPWKKHLSNDHGLHTCSLCTKNQSCFPNEIVLYKEKDFEEHVKNDHDTCKFCDKLFYDRDSLFKHLRLDHFYCKICETDGNHEFYNKIEDLKDHLESEHVMCRHPKCNHGLCYSVFKTTKELNAHVKSVHPGSRKSYYYVWQPEENNETPSHEVNLKQKYDHNQTNYPTLSTDFPTSNQSSSIQSRSHAGLLNFSSQSVNETSFPTIGTPNMEFTPAIRFKAARTSQPPRQKKPMFPSLPSNAKKPILKNKPKLTSFAENTSTKKNFDIQKFCSVNVRHKKVNNKR